MFYIVNTEYFVSLIHMYMQPIYLLFVNYSYLIPTLFSVTFVIVSLLCKCVIVFEGEGGAVRGVRALDRLSQLSCTH